MPILILVQALNLLAVQQGAIEPQRHTIGVAQVSIAILRWQNLGAYIRDLQVPVELIALLVTQTRPALPKLHLEANCIVNAHLIHHKI
ncbi:MAG: hypothetical protein A3A80_02530 [Candidatus Terrybacteria bacterium RIFCSPLOWO2_01_FULL_44_24]|uniref:Uncharacterized protein n=1 Tax=Candidatus Terrybacteria bacterium RIFCSPHIGHO2_01_FULL_43_35 TaxID=1802361 RepID=A0A1G2PEJ9_9BACT|nr:MAG: hypothetical protein A2828_02325 [Candidatus Terrybacteria bacterium RIFCSPHIGHO2_01_FULL_43_35]OHA50297.1 MAG: hypothetical protein A3B75_00670 [Candidatus Terrybacteria bacterium RIFCSPHIGHO2_02_FULL_43_14]OHA50950.1 MAG: hypothetical protein A3A80_02530 [Candidatus Terrybacteria bacterium RIFCSPLOWO2_01_FULL_44_24]